jgi:hypothetical protein
VCSVEDEELLRHGTRHIVIKGRNHWCIIIMNNPSKHLLKSSTIHSLLSFSSIHSCCCIRGTRWWSCLVRNGARVHPLQPWSEDSPRMAPRRYAFPSSGTLLLLCRTWELVRTSCHWCTLQGMLVCWNRNFWY